MTAIFYFIGFLISIMLLSGLFDYPKMTALRRSYNLTGDKKSKLDSIIRKKDTPVYTRLLSYAFVMLCFMSWCAIGLLSNNWLAFLVLLLSYIVVSKLINLIGGKHSISYFKMGLNMIMVVCISASCMFMSVNHFYLKHDLEPIIKTELHLDSK